MCFDVHIYEYVSAKPSKKIPSTESPSFRNDTSWGIRNKQGFSLKLLSSLFTIQSNQINIIDMSVNSSLNNGELSRLPL